MPFIYHPQTTVYRVIPAQLQFRVIGVESCELLERNFRRISRNMFGDSLHEDDAENPASDVGGSPPRLLRVVRWLNVTVLKECVEFPYLEMDESCKYFHADNLRLLHLVISPFLLISI